MLRSVSAGLQRMGLADRIEVRQLGRSSRYELLVHKDGVAANLRDVGVGVAQVLPVLTVAYSVPPGSTVLLEEPEIHLHPLAQAVLAELFAEVSQQRRVQFLVETHSEHLFRRMQTLLARRQTTTAQCQMLFVERQGANAVLVPLEVDEFGAVRNWPPRCVWIPCGWSPSWKPWACWTGSDGLTKNNPGAMPAMFCWLTRTQRCWSR